MRTVVCLKFCPDTSQLRADPASGLPLLDDVPWRVSTLDEHALELAVRLKELHGGTVTGVSLVAAEPPRDLVLRTLAVGLDELHLLVDPDAARADALATARILAASEATRGADLILCGEASSDRFDQQVGPRLAEELDLPSLTHVRELEREGPQVRALRLLDDREELVECALPALATVGQETFSPRLPSVLQVVGAGRRPVRLQPVSELSGLGGGAAAHSGVETLAVWAPQRARKGVRVEGRDPAEIAERLVRLLGAEGLVGSR